MSSANGVAGKKRPATSSQDALAALRATVVAQMADLSGKSAADIESAAVASPEATVLELGLTSAQGVSLKGWVFKTLEAELTTFELLKQPLRAVIEAIGAPP